MKYIRTKDGIIYQDALQMVDGNWQVLTKNNRYIKVSNNLISKQANTIERLCDRFVVDFENGEEPAAFKNYLDALSYFGKAKIYGAIWTDKGLIYIAKLNDKGDLELL